MSKGTWLYYFPFILLLLIISAASGWFIENLYEGDSALMAVKFRFNDLVLLTLITPLSVLMLILAFTGRLWARVFVLGIIMHVAFSYGITVFNSRQNYLFWYLPSCVSWDQIHYALLIPGSWAYWR